MYVGVIRGDLPGSVELTDLETVSQYNPPTEPSGQECHIGRPVPSTVAAFLSNVPAAIQSTAALTFPLTIDGTNDVLRVQLAPAGPFSVVHIANAAYASMSALLTAVNAAIVAAPATANAITDASGTLVILQSNAKGPAAYIGIDSVAGGSTFNAAANLTDSASFTMPSATATITAFLPIDGALDVSDATIATTLGASPLASGVVGLIAKKLVETDVVIKSFQVGSIAAYRSVNYTPDPNRLPLIAKKAAISVVQDDGVTPFVAAVPTISGAAHNTPNPGDLRITGLGLANAEDNQTKVRITDVTTLKYITLSQKVINTTNTGGTQGSVTATQIDIPASLLGGLAAAAGNKVKVQYTSQISNEFTIT